MSPAYRFHPEFGYFCPTPGFRYKLRVALLLMVIGETPDTCDSASCVIISRSRSSLIRLPSNSPGETCSPLPLT